MNKLLVYSTITTVGTTTFILIKFSSVKSYSVVYKSSGDTNFLFFFKIQLSLIDAGMLINYNMVYSIR